MKYNFIETSDIKEEYLKKHNLDLFKYDDYDFSINEDVIDSFYNELLNNRNLKFLIVGDYDCDGICSVTIIKNLFKYLNINNNYYIPSRIKEGYGLNKLIVDNAIKYKYDAILLVDNGVSCKDAIDYAYKNNIKVFIIDHHKYEELPRCEAIIHQNLLSKEFEYASAGELCFLLSLKAYFDEYNLVLGGLTILSDYININSFNRFLLSEMINTLNDCLFEPLNYLNESNKYTSTSITYNIIPKINSISRLESDKFNPNHLVRYLLSSFDDLKNVSLVISDINNRRKNETNDIFNKIISNKYDSNYIFICSEDINEGYCSSLATKLSNYFDKTVFIFNENDGICKGSCRCQSLDIHSLLLGYNKFLSFGGHEHAVGISIKKDDLDDFISYLNNIDFNNSEETIEDVYIVDPSLINEKLLNDINSLGPFGNGYEMPIIGIKNKDYTTSIIKNKYTKFIINDSLSAITFDEKYLGFKPEYIFGSLNKDNYHIGAYSIIIKGLE